MKYKKMITASVVVVSLAGFFWYVINKNKTVKEEYITAKVEFGDLVQTVDEVGTIKSSKELELNFSQAGKLAVINVKTGDVVKKDQVLAELDYSSIKIKEQEARANLDVARASLQKTLAGASNEEVAIQEANVAQAKSNYNSSLSELERTKKTIEENVKQAEASLFDLGSGDGSVITPSEQAIITAEKNLENAKNTYNQAILNSKNNILILIDEKISLANTSLDKINRILNDRDVIDFFSVKDLNYRTKTENAYNESVSQLDVARLSLVKAKTSMSEASIKTASNDCLEALKKVFECLNYCYSALDYSVTSNTFTQSELDASKADINTQITYVSSSLSSLKSSEQALNTAVLNYEINVANAENGLSQAKVNLEDAIRKVQDSLATIKVNGEQQITISNSKIASAKEVYEVALAQLANIKSSARNEDVSLNQAKIRQAEATLDLILSQINDSIIKSPIDGRVTEIGYEIGEQVSLAKPVIIMSNGGDFEVDVDISEADIAKINLNDPATVTLDAFGDEVKFLAKVNFIEPAETVIQDVIYYKVKLNLLDSNNVQKYQNEIKSGMTANITVTTERKNNILIMPGRAIVEKNGSSESGSDKYVRLLVNSVLKEVPVSVGLKGDGGLIEVLSGVNEGDEVITYIKENK